MSTPTPTRVLGEGDVIDVGDRACEVLHLSGHSPGSLGWWEMATGVLFPVMPSTTDRCWTSSDTYIDART